MLMIPHLARQVRLLIACMVIVSGFPEVRLAYSSEIPSGTVGGTVTVVWGVQTYPVRDAKLELTSISGEGPKYRATTDSTGKYAVDLPPGTYKMLLSWMGGFDCAEVHRASFRLDAAAHLTLDFLVMQCPTGTPIWEFLPPEEAKKEAEKYARSRQTNPMNVPMAEQTEKYQEQLIPAEQNRPEIVLAFGKYDNRADEIQYFPLHQMVSNPFHIPNPPIPLSLPVTITVDRYTLRGSSVILEKGRMLFTVSGQVSLSDGTHTTNGDSATLSFSGGEPKIEINR